MRSERVRSCSDCLRHHHRPPPPPSFLLANPRLGAPWRVRTIPGSRVARISTMCHHSFAPYLAHEAYASSQFQLNLVVYHCQPLSLLGKCHPVPLSLLLLVFYHCRPLSLAAKTSSFGPSSLSTELWCVLVLFKASPGFLALSFVTIGNIVTKPESTHCFGFLKSSCSVWHGFECCQGSPSNCLQSSIVFWF